MDVDMEPAVANAAQLAAFNGPDSSSFFFGAHAHGVSAERWQLQAAATRLSHPINRFCMSSGPQSAEDHADQVPSGIPHFSGSCASANSEFAGGSQHGQNAMTRHGTSDSSAYSPRSCALVPPMPVSSVDAMRPPSPPPAGTMDDLDYEEEAASAFEERFTGVDSRVRRQIHQLEHWKGVLKAFPSDPLAFFWREQIATLEAHVMGQQSVGTKRVLNSDWCDLLQEGREAMEDSPSEPRKRHRF
mmetsp:Transcript_60193/g.141734  ORF Transcript_60193/g.141734 Transcript_60193/m.141734 type:complete len:244 (-) Transcript_60193:95-826(-)